MSCISESFFVAAFNHAVFRCVKNLEIQEEKANVYNVLQNVCVDVGSSL